MIFYAIFFPKKTKKCMVLRLFHEIVDGCLTIVIVSLIVS